MTIWTTPLRVSERFSRLAGAKEDIDRWVGVKNNLAVALSLQGVWKGSEDGSRMLGDAAAVYRDVLEVRTREADEVAWAGAQGESGAAFLLSGPRWSGGRMV